MSTHHKWLTVFVGTVASAGLLGMTATVASAKTPPPPPAVAAGPTTCTFNGSLQVTDTSNLGLVANMTPYKHNPACDNTGGTTVLKTGHLRGAVSSDSWTDLCVLLTGTQPSDLSGAYMFWSPRTKVADSTGVSLTGGNLSQVVALNGKTYLQLGYSGTVTSGSFTGSFTVIATSTASVTGLQNDCASGPVTGVHFRGTISLS